MTTIEAPKVTPAAPALPDAEALFKEAQRRRRNRRLLGAGILAVALLLLGLVGLAIAGNGDAASPVVPRDQPAFANTVTKAMVSSKGASFTLVDQAPVSACAANTGPQVTVTRGSADFARQTMVSSTTVAACPSLSGPLTVRTPTATYERVGSNVAPAIGTTDSRPWLKSSSRTIALYFSAGSVMLDPKVSTLLKAIPGPLAIGPTTTINGITSTEYRGTTTLAVLEHSDPGFAVVRTVSVLPSAASIHVPVQIWLDRQGRIARITSSEPIFSEVYADGSTASGSEVGAIGSQVPPAPATSSPREVGFDYLTLTFKDFGAKVITVPSATVTVASGK